MVINIYKVSVDLSYKLLSLLDNSSSEIKRYSFSKDNSNKNLREDFDAQCYGNEFIIKKTYLKKLKEILSNKLESFDIEIIDYNSDTFFLVNILSIIKSISFDDLDYKQSMEMIKSNNISFNKGNIGSSIVFRDEKLTNFIYCKHEFIDFIEENNIKGLRFDKVGEAR